MKKELTMHQAIIIICLCSVTLKITILPAYMSTFCGGNFWIVTLMIFISETISLALIVDMAKRCPDKTFFEILESGFGKWIKTAIGIIFLVFFIFKMILVIYETEIFIKSSIYENFNEWLFFLAFLLFVVYVASKSFSTLGRVSELMMYLVIGGAVISLMLSVIEVNFSDILPITDISLKSMLDCGGKASFWFGDYLIFLMMTGNIKYEDKPVSKFVKGYMFVGVFVVALYIIFNCLFKNVTTIHQTAISDVSHYMPRFNDFRLDWVGDIMWIFCQMFSACIWVCVTRLAVLKTVKIKNKNLFILFIFMILVLFIIDVFHIAVYDYINFIATYFWWIPILVTQTPLLMFLGLKKRRKEKNEPDAI